MSKVYEIVTQKIVEQLEQGVIPWRKPWVGGGAVSWKTQRPYRGINTMLLEPGEYATHKQITEAGGKVKKGETSHLVVFWKWTDLTDEDGEPTGERVPYLRYYKVFEIGQCEGLKSKRKAQTFEHDPIEEGEKIVSGYMNSPDIRYKSGKAYYSPSMDYIGMPPMKDFYDPHSFYSVLFHEMVHSTGHTSRLNRPGVTSAAAAFGSETYSKEELVAELGAAMLCGVAGIHNHTIDNSASYISSWLRALKDDKKLIVTAAAQAQKAADYILGTKFED